LAMLGLGYAAVPLYRMFCQATGFGGTPMRVSEAQAARVKSIARSMSIRFDANVDPGMKWQFAPEQNTQQVKIGERSLAIFTAENISDHEIDGAASYNIAPDEAARYFNKIQCFCFNLQKLAPHQKIRMPVSYYVDPKILDDKDLKGLQQITLSYTFHPVAPQPKS
jgi:cytochrome c oxidase assembly protein subunit 11